MDATEKANEWAAEGVLHSEYDRDDGWQVWIGNSNYYDCLNRDIMANLAAFEGKRVRIVITELPESAVAND